MPLYEYECDNGHRFELIRKFSDPPLEACAQCGAPVHKLFSSPAIQFKGSGFYITDYAKSDSGGPPKSSGGKDQDSGGSEKSDTTAKADTASTSSPSTGGDTASKDTAKKDPPKKDTPKKDTVKKDG